MSKRVIDKGFYEIYPKYFKDFSRELKKQIGKCQSCGHDGSGKNYLTTAHLDQNPTNNEPENIKVLCRSCHIQFDQKFHLFTMSTSKKTDNSHLPEKVDLRLDVISQIDKDLIIVLDVFHGDGLIWKEVASRSKKEIRVIPIEIKNNKKGFYLMGDNNKFLPLFDFSHFDIIDLDSYGIPFNQLEVCFYKNFKGFIIVTAIQSFGPTGGGNLNHGMLNKLGYTDKMIKKCPALFNKNGIDKLKNYLYLYGCQSIIGYFIDRKNYFYFKIPE